MTKQSGDQSSQACLGTPVRTSAFLVNGLHYRWPGASGYCTVGMASVRTGAPRAGPRRGCWRRGSKLVTKDMCHGFATRPRPHRRRPAPRPWSPTVYHGGSRAIGLSRRRHHHQRPQSIRSCGDGSTTTGRSTAPPRTCPLCLSAGHKNIAFAVKTREFTSPADSGDPRERSRTRSARREGWPRRRGSTPSTGRPWTSMPTPWPHTRGASASPST
jgi:hypothetical protein